MKRHMMTNVRISGGYKRVTVAMGAPDYATLRIPGQPDKEKEINTVTEDEANTLSQLTEQWIMDELSKKTKTGKP